jgi:hypothetical protein
VTAKSLMRGTRCHFTGYTADAREL